MRCRQPLLPGWLVALLLGCGGPAPTMPSILAPSLDSWARIGLACAGPSRSDHVEGLLTWTCSGTLSAVPVTAAIDGDARGVFLASVSLPAATLRATTVDIFANVADGTPAYAADAPQIRVWLHAWDGQADGSTFGTTSVAIVQVDALGSPSSIAFYMTGPRRDIGDPIP